MAAAESDDEVPSTSHSIVSAFEEQVFDRRADSSE